jgi:hypothetical protein
MSSLAASLTPPAPPTFVPTPIGRPPDPPTSTAVATVGATPGTTSVVTATPAPTKVAAPALNYSLDAVRVAKVNNPGNLAGLVEIKPGTKVWLMLYYTVRTLPKATSRLAVYTIEHDGKSIFKVAYKGDMKRGEVGRYSRYTVYDAPRSLAFGKYVYQAALTIGKKTQVKSWNFTVGPHEREVTTGQG